MWPQGPPLIPFLDSFILPSFTSCQLVSRTISTSTPGDVHADSHDSMLMLPDDKSPGHLWPKRQLHPVCAHMSETVEILNQFE